MAVFADDGVPCCAVIVVLDAAQIGAYAAALEQHGVAAACRNRETRVLELVSAILFLDEVRQGGHQANLDSICLQKLAEWMLGNVAAEVAPDLDLLPVLDDDRLAFVVEVPERPLAHLRGVFDARDEIGRASCRERV